MATKTKTKNIFKKDAVADIVDFRDKLYTPTLVEVPQEISVITFRKKTGNKITILNQGQEGSCTGFALATVAHYLLLTRRVYPDANHVSPHMIYMMAKKYDEWRGEDYSGSSARGAMKGWHKHGMCSLKNWDDKSKKKSLDYDDVRDASERPLGAYFRVNNKDIIAMHSAITETGILYCTLDTHTGWDDVGTDGMVPFDTNKYHPDGGHAIAFVGYDHNGFWFQNSWGKDWGSNGYGHISYDDWLTNGSDVWVARLGVPISQTSMISGAISAARSNQSSISNHKLRPHIVSLDNDGLLKETGTFGNTDDDLKTIFTSYFPEMTKGWSKKRILLYAHGGLVPEESAVQRVADYHQKLLDNQIYPIFFIWHSGFWETIKDLLSETVRSRRSEGALGDAWNFVLDKVDTMIESVARIPGKKMWDEMKENAMYATILDNGGAMKTIKYINDILENDKTAELHIVGHSAGSIFHAPLLQKLCTEGNFDSSVSGSEKGFGKIAKTVTMWAPAMTTSVFNEYYMPLIKDERIEQFNLFMLDDQTEQDDNCGGIYNKSLLYLVSNSFEEQRKVPGKNNSGEPILGMEKFLTKEVENLFKINSGHNKIISPETGAGARCKSKAHGDFDDDQPCLATTLSYILSSGKKLKSQKKVEIDFNRSSASMKDKRVKLDKVAYEIVDRFVGEIR